jgi:uncharacterized protein (TIGR03437 family)
MAQFIATDEALYFAGVARLATDPPPHASNLFRYSPSRGFEWLAPVWGPIFGDLTDISSDGQIFVVHWESSQIQCSNALHSSCHDVPYFVEWTFSQTGQLDNRIFYDYSNGKVQVSRNGRYVLYGPMWLWDMVSRTSRKIKGTQGNGQSIADDGTVVSILNSFQGVLLSRPDGEDQIATQRKAVAARIDRNATRIAYTTDAQALVALDLRTRAETVIRDSAVQSYNLSSDGQLLAYLAIPSSATLPHVYLARTDGSSDRQLTTQDVYPEGFKSMSMSPDGRWIYAMSYANRLVRIDAITGAVLEIAPRTPSIDFLTPLSPGTMAEIHGTGLSDWKATAEIGAPLPLSLGGATVNISDIHAPMIYADPNLIRFQVPFEVPHGPLTIALPTKSPLKSSWTTVVDEAAPTFASIAAIHQDFSSLVSQASPAQPGEVIHYYALGLGAVSPAVATGQPTPNSPPSRTSLPVRCQLLNRDGLNELTIPFAGLAPGMYGVYQIDVVVPDYLGALSALALDCTIGTRHFAN